MANKDVGAYAFQCKSQTWTEGGLHHLMQIGLKGLDRCDIEKKKKEGGEEKMCL